MKTLLNASDLASLKENTLEGRGKRLRYVREQILRVKTRTDFPSIYPDSQISLASLENWESDRYGGLTEKGAKKICALCKEQGIECKLEWLLFGAGQMPFYPTQFSTALALEKPLFSVSEEESITKELQYFSELNKDVFDTIVNDDGLYPYFLLGDHVAGSRYRGQDIKLAINKLCIVQTQNGQVLTRKVLAGSKEDLYHLVCTNQDATVVLTLPDVPLLCAAPIIWIRRPLAAIFND